MSRRLSILLTVMGVALLWLTMPKLASDSQQLIRTRMLMGTVVEIRVLADDADRFQPAVDQVFAEMARLEELLSPHRSNSEISRLSLPDESVAPSRETLEVIAIGQEVAAVSNGAFDLGLGRLIRLWGFAAGEPRLPEAEEIAAALQGVGPDDVSLQQGRVVKSHPRLEVDLGGVAKGYAVDRAVAILMQAGVKHATVNAGGDLRLIGDHRGRPWRIGIQHPRRPGEVLVRLELSDRAVVTSGDYERSIEIEGQRYHHILDARSGYPADGCQSVTVVADSAALADALATAAFVLGPEAGLALLTAQPGVEGLIIAADGRPVMTKGLQEILQWP